MTTADHATQDRVAEACLLSHRGESEHVQEPGDGHGDEHGQTPVRRGELVPLKGQHDDHADGERADHQRQAAPATATRRPSGLGAQMTPSACSTWASLGGASGGVIGPRAEGHPTLGGDGMDCPGTMTGPLRFRTVQVMDGKLAEMAKGTVFARCTRRELIVLGRLFEVARLAPGAALPAGDGRWLHVVLEGRALSIVEGRPDGMLGEGAIWPGSGQGRPQHDLRTGECVVAPTEVTLASVATRCLGAVARVAARRWAPG